MEFYRSSIRNEAECWVGNGSARVQTNVSQVFTRVHASTRYKPSLS